MDKVLDIRKLRCVAAAIFLVWIVAQCIVVIHYWGVPQYSDAGNYQRLAFQCYSEGTWYPTVAQLNSEPYVINPGYVNYLIIVLNVFGTLDIVPLFNIVFNAALALTVFLIIRHLAGEVCAHAGVIMYCLIWSNTIIVATTMSELLFGLLVYVSIALVRDRWPALLASGALVAAANYVRPVAVLFVVPVVAYMFICRFGRRSMISYATGLALVLSSLCLFNYRVNGHAIVAASTSGINMLIGASDQANGSFECTVFDEGNAGYIPNETGLDVFGKDSVWLKKAERWVSEHPADYIALMPEKVDRKSVV